MAAASRSPGTRPRARSAVFAEPLLQVNAIFEPPIHVLPDLEFMTSVLAVEIAAGRIFPRAFHANAIRAGGAGHVFEPAQNGTADAAPAVRASYGKQQQVRVITRVEHDAETDDGALLAGQHHVGVAITNGMRHALFRPRPRQPVLDVVARHRGDLRGVGEGGESNVDVGDHGPTDTLARIGLQHGCCTLRHMYRALSLIALLALLPPLPSRADP